MEKDCCVLEVSRVSTIQGFRRIDVGMSRPLSQSLIGITGYRYG